MKPSRIALEYGSRRPGLQGCVWTKTAWIGDLPRNLILKIFSHFTPEFLVLVVRRTCANWKEIVDDDEFWRNRVYVPRVIMPDKFLYISLMHMKYLRKFFLDHRRNISNILRLIAKFCPKIEEMTFRFKDNYLKSETVMFTLYKVPGVRSFVVFLLDYPMMLDYGKLRTDLGLGMFTMHVSKTHYQHHWPWPVHHQNHIKHLLNGTPMKQIHDELLQKRQYLKYLGLDCDVTDEVLKEVARCESLENLVLFNNEKSGPEVDLSPLLKLTQLQSLQLSKIRAIHYDSYECVLDPFPQLVKLEVVDCGPALDSLVNSMLRVAPMLKHVSVQEGLITNEDLEGLAFCEHLEYLDLSKNPLLTNTCMRYVGQGCHRLKFLDITACPNMDDDFFCLIERCKQLEMVRLEGEYFSGSYFPYVTLMFPKLCHLYIGHFKNLYFLKEIFLKLYNKNKYRHYKPIYFCPNVLENCRPHC
ncbi:uncharacterized protein [Periplaneta americana]|uniref:uncharacterized protein n=1 Tax=Periplaneta americana TaxID=6978 RepID=UPI0037E991B3